MLHRNLNDGYLAITQPAHAWLSGQLATHWGNDLTGEIQPRADVVLAAEQHDIGWLEWEAEPTLNPQTGRPKTFRELGTNEHLSVWAPAGPRALVYGPYVAMLVSMHGTGLYQFHDYSRDTEQEAEAARRFIEHGAQFEQVLLQQMRSDQAYASYCNDATITRNRRLVAVCDAISLFMCGGLTEAREIKDVPARDGAITLRLTPDTANCDIIQVEPWPFSSNGVRLTTVGKKLDATFTEQAAMRSALETAPWQLIEIVLHQ